MTVFLQHFTNAPRDSMFPKLLSVLLSPASRLQNKLQTIVLTPALPNSLTPKKPPLCLSAVPTDCGKSTKLTAGRHGAELRRGLNAMTQTPGAHALIMMKQKQKPVKRQANALARHFAIFAASNKRHRAYDVKQNCRQQDMPGPAIAGHERLDTKTTRATPRKR